MADQATTAAPPSLDELRGRREEIIAIAGRRGARNIRVFGSVARGEEDADSDLDLLVDLDAGSSLFDLGGLVMDLQDVLGCPVDVAEFEGLRHRVRTRVLAEAVAL